MPRPRSINYTTKAGDGGPNSSPLITGRRRIAKLTQKHIAPQEMADAAQALGTSNPYPVSQPPTSEISSNLPGAGDEYPFIPGLEGAVGRVADRGFDAIIKGARQGFQYGTDPLDARRTKTRSVIGERAPEHEYNWLPPEGRVAYLAGRVGADVSGHGSRSYLWGAHPEDFVNRSGGNYLSGIPGKYRAPVLYGSALVLGGLSGQVDPANLVDGGRPQGFSAISNDTEDTRRSTAPVYDYVVQRGLFGRRGRLLPWNEFTQERPDVSFEKYNRYRDYLYNRDDNPLRDLTLGFVKATPDGINGPEASIMGYSVTPTGFLGAIGTLGLARYAGKKYANLM